MAKKGITSIDDIKCPNCGHNIPLTEVLSHQIAEATRKEMRSEMVSAQENLTARERAVDKLEEDAAKIIDQRVEATRKRIQEDAERSATEKSRVALAAATARASEVEAALVESQAAELELRNRAAKMERREQEIDVEVARKVDAGRAAAVTVAREQMETDFKLKSATAERQLAEALSRVSDLQRRLEQGSEQSQGEALEFVIERDLAAAFPLDAIQPVPKGVNGADVVQVVNRRDGSAAGSIIWELKRTQNFNDGWIAKLKADQRVAKSDVAVLVSAVLPKGVDSFSMIDGVWVCSIRHAVALACAIRVQLVEVSAAKASQIGRGEKMEFVYDYLSGSGFRQRVEAIVEAFQEMNSDIAEERRVAERRWAKREKQVLQVIAGTAGMYGDLQGLIGSTMGTIPLLEHKP